MPSVPTPPRNSGWTLSASVTVYPTYAASQLRYFAWLPGGSKRGKDLTVRTTQARVATIDAALESLIATLEAYRRTLQ